MGGWPRERKKGEVTTYGASHRTPSPEYRYVTQIIVKVLQLKLLGGGGVRGLCSLLILHRLMQQVKDLEVSQYPESKDWPRFPCRYFDLVGGTSTGG